MVYDIKDIYEIVTWGIALGACIGACYAIYRSRKRDLEAERAPEIEYDEAEHNKHWAKLDAEWKTLQDELKENRKKDLQESAELRQLLEEAKNEN